MSAPTAATGLVEIKRPWDAVIYNAVYGYPAFDAVEFAALKGRRLLTVLDRPIPSRDRNSDSRRKTDG